MAIIPLKIPDGIYKNGTDNQGAGRWNDSQLIRFFEGSIRPVLGWRSFSPNVVSSNATDCPRGLHAWKTTGGSRFLAVGVFNKVYAYNISKTRYDITPTDFTIGRISGEENLGYGGYTYGSDLYGTERQSSGDLLDATIFHFDNYGEDLLFCTPDDGKLRRWELNTSNPATTVLNSPNNVKAIVTSENRFVFCCQARTINWCSQEQIEVWTPSSTNSAGSLTLSTSGTIQSATRTRKQVCFMTDEDFWVGNYLGSPFFWGFEKVGTTGIISPRAYASFDLGVVFMGQRGIYLYNGGVLKKINCDVADFVFDNINISEKAQIYCFENSQYSEITWFYPSTGKTHCDSYVTWNYEISAWTVGKMDRSCGVDKGVFDLPIYASSIGKSVNSSPSQIFLFEHEVGLSYPETTGSASGTPFIESGDIELGNDKILNVTKVIPDEKTLGDVNLKFKSKLFPTSTPTVHPSSGSFSGANPTSVRISGKQIKIRLEANDSQPSDFRIGTYRLEGKVGSGR